MVIYDNTGQAIRLGAELGRGGEGKVFEVSDRQQLVAKIYHQFVDREKAAKLSLMTQLRTDRLLQITAWPVGTLHNKLGGEVVGFLMPKAYDCKAIHTLYGPKDRLKTFPNATWPFLIHAATNVAAAFATIHEHGHVVGDVNHGNLVVSNNAIVKFIDCDSFQITANGNQFLCEVGVSTHTPPELQERPLRGIVRTTNHDAFGLAVLIFQLLFMGRHPYSGGYLGVGYLPLEKAIREFRFAYGPGAASRQMKQPPATLALTTVSPSLASLFERAFSPEGVRQGERPTPLEWIKSLRELMANLASCNQHSGHHFLRTLASCPWCEIESKAGTLFFNFVVVGENLDSSNFNLGSLWSQIAAVPPPGPLPKLQTIASLNLQPSVFALEQRKKHNVDKGLAWGLVLVIIATLFVSEVNSTTTFLIIVGAIALATKIANARIKQVIRDAEGQLKAAQGQWQSVEQRWQRDAGDSSFLSKLRELEKLKAQYQDLPNLLVRKLEQLETERKQRQLYNFLDRHRIYSASIPGVGASRKVTLQSYGIETAADIKESAILAISGFGPSLTASLMSWRKSIESKFVFNPSLGVDPNDISAVKREIIMTRMKLERELQDGLTALRQISQQIVGKRQVLRPMIEGALNGLAQAEADWKVLSPKG